MPRRKKPSPKTPSERIAQFKSELTGKERQQFRYMFAVKGLIDYIHDAGVMLHFLTRGRDEWWLVKQWDDQDPGFKTNKTQKKLLNVHILRWSSNKEAAEALLEDPTATVEEIELFLESHSFYREYSCYIQFTLEWQYTKRHDGKGDQILSHEREVWMHRLMNEMVDYIRRLREECPEEYLLPDKGLEFILTKIVKGNRKWNEYA